MQKWFVTVIGVALFAIGCSGSSSDTSSPAATKGTLTVNVLGCFLLGGLMYCVQERAVLSPAVRPFLAIGVAGAFTTFSTFGYETLELVENRELAAALANVGGNVCLGLGAVWLGRTVLRATGI